jgi:type II secretory pathway predicted ATPase ExeA
MEEFKKLLAQATILDNMILTGLRGVGKTVLLETLKPIAMSNGWLWVGNGLSEASSFSEESLSTRIMADLAVVTSNVKVGERRRRRAGLVQARDAVQLTMDFAALSEVWSRTPGLTSDKLTAVLEAAWGAIHVLNVRGVVFAYDEAQNLADHTARGEYPMSLLLDVFQSIQRKGIPFMLVLAGLPTLFPKLLEARTYAERMFHLVMLERLTRAECEDAILKPIQEASCPVQFTEDSVDRIYAITQGYPYFVQYVCREAFDVWSWYAKGAELPMVPLIDIMRKLDNDFYAGRWSRATDRQRDLLILIAYLPTSNSEFTVQEIVEASRREGSRPFSNSHVSQMLVSLADAGLVYKNRWGKYSLAVPMLDEFIRRQIEGG